jgi:ABC-type multidrug transport system fused ATPase/permease subunit
VQLDRKTKKVQILLHRQQRAARAAAGLRRVEARYPWARLGVLAASLVVIIASFQMMPLLLAWLVVFLGVGVFAFVAVLHNRVIERINRLDTFEKILKTHIARANLDWINIPPPQPVTSAPDHPFSGDLNLLGERSLHQLLDTAASSGGSLKLASWLLNPLPDPRKIGERQRLVSEMIASPAYISRLELNGTLANPDAHSRWDTQALVRWLEVHTSAATLRPVLIALGLLAGLNITLFVLHATGILPPWWFASMAVYLGLQSMRFRETSEVFGESYELSRQLGRLRIVFADLERYPYRPGRMATLCAPFCQADRRPSAALRRISLIASAASLRNNPFLSLLLNLLVPWDVFFAYQLEKYKRQLGGLLPAWLEAWYQLEALASLANFAALNPENTFPHILPQNSEPVLNCRGAGHPLIPDAVRVTNNFKIHSLGEVVIITGSNMSGKSTFLRTLGANLVLAYVGSTAAVQDLHVIPFRLFTSMTLNDSLSDGISFFYAEVRRLKALLNQLDEGDALPLFFLIDEIFRGTNNRERQQGSRAYTSALAGRHGTGLISTHDLELVHLEEDIPAVSNYHFREDILNEKMVFDYKIRAGASPTTNALRIMELAGLPVPKTKA